MLYWFKQTACLPAGREGQSVFLRGRQSSQFSVFRGFRVFRGVLEVPEGGSLGAPVGFFGLRQGYQRASVARRLRGGSGLWRTVFVIWTVKARVVSAVGQIEKINGIDRDPIRVVAGLTIGHLV